MPKRALKDTDARDTAELLRIGFWFGGSAFVLLTLAEFWVIHQRGLAAWILLPLMAANLPVVAGGVFLLWRGVGSGAGSLVRMLSADGNIAGPPSYPHADALIAGGRYAEAADFFRDHIRIEPGDLTARLRLADLLEEHQRDFGGAEQLYLEVRRLRPDARQEVAVANGLIDLYRRAGRPDRLKVELARFAERYRGTKAGEAAGRELRELKGGEAGSGKREG